jgi:hypothetical protein
VQLATSTGRLETERLTTGEDGRASTVLIGSTRAQVTATAGALTKTIDVDNRPGFTIFLNAPPSALRGERITIGITVTTTIPELRFTSAAIDFGDGISASLELKGFPMNASVGHHYDRTGALTVVVGITDSLGIAQQLSQVIQITNVVGGGGGGGNNVPPPPSYMVSVVASPNPVVQGVQTMLTATAVPINGAASANAYDWDCDNDGIFDFHTTGNTQACLYPASGLKTATVVAKNETVSGKGTVSIQVVTAPQLFVDIAAGNYKPGIGEPVIFTATVTAAGGATVADTFNWQWDFEGVVCCDGVSSSPRAQTHTFGSAGVKTIKIHIMDPITGRTADGIQTITVM